MVKVIFKEVKDSTEIKKDMAVVDMHCHTNLSDGRDSADLMIRQAEKLNIGISITDHNRIAASLEACKRIFSVPIAVGFGISNKERVSMIKEYADVAVIGSAVIDVIKSSKKEDMEKNVASFLKSLIV